MKLRAIQNGDLKVTKGWFASGDRQRVHVSLIGLPFVNKTYWLREEVQSTPDTLARVKRDLLAALERKVKGLERYLAR